MEIKQAFGRATLGVLLLAGTGLGAAPADSARQTREEAFKNGIGYTGIYMMAACTQDGTAQRAIVFIGISAGDYARMGASLAAVEMSDAWDAAFMGWRDAVKNLHYYNFYGAAADREGSDLSIAMKQSFSAAEVYMEQTRKVHIAIEAYPLPDREEAQPACAP